jgi:integrase
MESFLWALAIMGEAHPLRIYTVLFETWQRKSTVEALTLRWVDFRHETVTIAAKHFKTRREKVIDLTPRAAEAIRGRGEEEHLSGRARLRAVRLPSGGGPEVEGRFRQGTPVRGRRHLRARAGWPASTCTG